VNVRGFRNLLLLTAEAERKIRAAGREPPSREYLMAVLAQHAKLVTRAAMAAAEAEHQAARAMALARECSAAALGMADAVADAVIEATPAVAHQQPYDPAKCAKFDPSKHTVQLVAVPGLAGTMPVSAGDFS
jgi:hypothetical protein